MVYRQSTRLTPSSQRPKGGYRFLAAILDGIDDAHLLDQLAAYRRTGRQGFPLRAMWRAYVSKFVLKIRFNLELLERLRGSRKLREVCGFDDDVPSEKRVQPVHYKAGRPSCLGGAMFPQCHR